MPGPAIAFTGVEELLFLLDSPSEPQNQRVELELPRPVDAARLRDALAAVVGRHDLLRARLRPWRSSDRQLAWEIGDELDDEPLMTFAASDDEHLHDLRDRVVSEPFTLVRSPPFRFALFERAGRAHLVLVAHHSALDLQGMVVVLRELAAAYAGRPAPRPERR